MQLHLHVLFLTNSCQRDAPHQSSHNKGPCTHERAEVSVEEQWSARRPRGCPPLSSIYLNTHRVTTKRSKKEEGREETTTATANINKNKQNGIRTCARTLRVCTHVNESAKLCQKAPAMQIYHSAGKLTLTTMARFTLSIISTRKRPGSIRVTSKFFYRDIEPMSLFWLLKSINLILKSKILLSSHLWLAVILPWVV